jgi:hypothetical protein
MLDTQDLPRLAMIAFSIVCKQSRWLLGLSNEVRASAKHKGEDAAMRDTLAMSTSLRSSLTSHFVARIMDGRLLLARRATEAWLEDDEQATVTRVVLRLT